MSVYLEPQFNRRDSDPDHLFWPHCDACGTPQKVLSQRDFCDLCELSSCIVCNDETDGYPYCGVQCQVDDLLAKGRTARQEGIHLATLLNTYCAEHPEAEQFYCEKCGRRCCIDCGETLAGEWPEPWACGACLA